MYRLGEKLRLLRTQRALSQVEVAHTIGLASSSHLSYLEAGRKTPSLEVVIKLAHVYQVPLDDLLRDDHAAVFTPSPRVPIDIERWPQHFALQLRRHRRAAGLTQAELARHLVPLTQAFVSQLEHGRKVPSPEIALRIADLFHVMIDDLFLAPPPH